MKRIHKLTPCNVLIIYEKKFPKAQWDKGENNFKAYRRGTLYNRLKSQVFQLQGGLCAYCETKITATHHQRIEHFHDKSKSTQSHNLHLDASNIFGVCLGGSSPKNTLYPTPKNLSCDAYKEHKNISYQEILNPFEMYSFPNLFKLKKQSGKLQADPKNCKSVTFPHNPYNSTEALVEATINNLNLNCDRLMSDRYKVIVAYNRAFKKGKEANDRDIKKKLAQRWFSQTFPSFFTTRRILLGEDAETYLKQISYNG